MAEDYNGDVDRAMAAFAAPPMRYVTFGPTVTTDAVGVSGREPLASRGVSTKQTMDFPLLNAALPGIRFTPISAPPMGAESTPAKPRASASAAKKAELLARRAGALDRQVRPPSHLATSPELINNTSDPSVVPDLPRRAAPTSKMVARPMPGPRVANERTITIATMFAALRESSPSQDQAPEAMPGLVDLFSRL